MEFRWDHLEKRLEDVSLVLIDEVSDWAVFLKEVDESSDWAVMVKELGDMGEWMVLEEVNDVTKDMVLFQEVSDVTENVEFGHSNEPSDSSNDGNDVSS